MSRRPLILVADDSEDIRNLDFAPVPAKKK
jgi:hypothetical protein